jgi:osmotically inducible lipoprotein OsmB
MCASAHLAPHTEHCDGESKMKTLGRARTLITAATLVTVLGSLAACDDMSRRDRDTVIGAGVGGAAGAAIGGNALSTVGGAAVGGVIGNQVGK